MHPHSDKPEIISTYAPYSEYYSGTKFYLALITSRQPWENFNNAGILKIASPFAHADTRM